MKNAQPNAMRPRHRPLRFVVQEHQSSHHHFDFRLEMAGVLKSWAIPKGPSMNPLVKRLAISVADHSLEYATYQGIIPEGTYGAGPVIIWDQGVYRLVGGGDPLAQLKGGHLTFKLDGTKLKGRYSIRRYPGRRNQWLLLKLTDEHANTHWEAKSELTQKRVKRLRVQTPPCKAA
jgi:bifunctional non-homologous end joining protein LigD